MSKERIVALFVLLLAILGGVVWLTKPAPEPPYQGRAMRSWLRDLEQWDGDTNNPAFAAFREMGTNALPPLLEILGSSVPSWQRTIMRFNRKQSVLELPLGTPWHKTTAAAWAIYAMGPSARPAFPALTNMLFSTNALITSAIALAGIGPEALPSLLQALTNQNHKIRHSAAGALGLERSNFDAVVPALISSLEDPVAIVRYSAATSLGELHAQPELAVPALMRAYSTNDHLLQALILVSLGEFETNAVAALPLVLTSLVDVDEAVSNSAAVAFSRISPAEAARGLSK